MSIYGTDMDGNTILLPGWVIPPTSKILLLLTTATNVKTNVDWIELITYNHTTLLSKISLRTPDRSDQKGSNQASLF